MRNVHMAQGKMRSKPDGFLHLNNFSHIAASGMAGVLFERIFTERQQEIVGCTLLEIAGNDPEIVHFKHNVWRFKKEFLLEHFQSVVYGTCRLLRKSPALLASIAITEEEQNIKKRIVGWPKG